VFCGEEVGVMRKKQLVTINRTFELWTGREDVGECEAVNGFD
jgi:hypothetical protein